MKIDISCAACGGNRFALTSAEEDDCPIACEDCGATIGTLGSLKEAVAAKVLRKR